MSENKKIILAIETSCDETSAAVLSASRGKLELLSNIVSSQINIHKQFGGVVPEVAARHHVRNFLPVVMEALELAKVLPKKIDLLATVAGPGLITSLIIGAEAAKALSFAWSKPLFPINHLYAHLAANFLQPIKFPAVCLIVSGGHTELVLLKDYWQHKKIGQTLDDAAGEAFDKVAKLLDLGYPGGPIVSVEAEKFSPPYQGGACLRRQVRGGWPMKRSATAGKPLCPSGTSPWKGEERICLPRPMLASKDFNFSFSGLKTAVLYTVQKMKPAEIRERTPEICFEFQQAVIEVLVGKTMKAADKFGAKTVLLAGGVAANKKLRENLRLKVEASGRKFLVPEFKLCTDNAGMVAIAAYFLAQKKKVGLDNYKTITVDPNWELN